MHIKDQTYLAKLGFADRDKREKLHDLACLYLAQPEKLDKLWATILADWAEESKNAAKARVVALEKKNAPFDDTRNQRFSFKNDWDTFIPKDLRDRCRVAYGYVKIIEENHHYPGDYWIKTATSISQPIYSTQESYRSVRHNLVGYYDLVVTYEVGFKVEVTPQVYLLEPSGGEQKRHLLPIGVLDKSAASYEEGDSKKLVIEVKYSPVTVNEILQQMRTYRAYEQDSGAQQLVATLFKLDSLSKDTLAQHGIKYIYLDPEQIRAFGNTLQSSAPEVGF